MQRLLIWASLRRSREGSLGNAFPVLVRPTQASVAPPYRPGPVQPSLSPANPVDHVALSGESPPLSVPLAGGVATQIALTLPPTAAITLVLQEAMKHFDPEAEKEPGVQAVQSLSDAQPLAHSPQAQSAWDHFRSQLRVPLVLGGFQQTFILSG